MLFQDALGSVDDEKQETETKQQKAWLVKSKIIFATGLIPNIYFR